MSKKVIHDWDEILTQCSKILRDNGNIEKVSNLYKLVKIPKKPKEDTFRKKIRSELGLKNERITKESLYRLVGKYSKNFLEALWEMSAAEGITSYSHCYLFIKINNYPDIRELLPKITRSFKVEFKEEVLFSTFDDDTIVLICRDEKAKAKIANYIKSLNLKKGENSV